MDQDFPTFGPGQTANDHSVLVWQQETVYRALQCRNHIRMKKLVSLFVFWSALGLFFAVQSVITYTSQGREVLWTAPLVYQLGYWYTWGLMAPIITWIVRRNPLDDGRRGRSVTRLVAAAFIIAPVQFVLASVIRTFGLYATSVIDADRMSASLDAIAGQVLTASFDSALTYWMIVGVVYAFHYYRKLQTRELNTSRLEASLSAARLQNLRAQLRPHFLFNTLNSISALVTKDPVAAEKMLAQLSELLRMSQDGDGKRTVSLRSEMKFARHYLEIEQTRFEDRLRISIQYDPPLAEIQIPPIILQPLVENAVAHGIAPFEVPGTVDVQARLIDDQLELIVRDSGPGFDPSSSGFRPGIGLSNTRRRLEQLFGDRFSMEFARPDEGGFEVRITLPTEEAA